MKYVLLTFETRSFDFSCVAEGTTEVAAKASARQALIDAWVRWSANMEADPDYVTDNEDSICYQPIEVGRVYERGSDRPI